MWNIYCQPFVCFSVPFSEFRMLIIGHCWAWCRVQSFRAVSERNLIMHLRKRSGSTISSAICTRCALGNCAILYDEFLIAASPTRKCFSFQKKNTSPMPIKLPFIRTRQGKTRLVAQLNNNPIIIQDFRNIFQSIRGRLKLLIFDYFKWLNGQQMKIEFYFGTFKLDFIWQKTKQTKMC